MKESLMLSLESPRWKELKHAYGVASDTPTLLRQLGTLPDASGQSEPWFTLWSSLAHQGDVFSASFAAVPHVIHALSGNPLAASATYFHFPAWVEICRQRLGMAVPEELQGPYFNALSQLPALAAAASARPWDSEMLSCVLAAVAVAKGDSHVAEAVLELSPESAASYLQWLSGQ
jgi:hypothetical protein